MSSLLKFRPSRVRANRQMLLLCGVLMLSACATRGGETTAPSRDIVEVEDPIAALITRETETPEEARGRGRRLGPTAESMIGGSLHALERVVGAPALVRAEGRNEFRRYDLGKCRAYAVVVPAGGRVQSLWTGPAKAGDKAPAFEQCTAGRSVRS